MDLLCAEAEKERVRRLEGEHCDDDTALPPLATATVETAEEADQADQKQQQQSMGDGEWECLDLRCAISFQPLIDPAKGSNCTHHACCNYKALRDYALASKRCPLENCRAQLRCTREVARDAKLKALLIHAPAGATAVWFRAEQLRTWQSHPASDLEEASALAALAGVPPVAGVSASAAVLAPQQQHAGTMAGTEPLGARQARGSRGAKRSQAATTSGGVTNVDGIDEGDTMPCKQRKTPAASSTAKASSSAALEASSKQGKPSSAAAAAKPLTWRNPIVLKQTGAPLPLGWAAGQRGWYGGQWGAGGQVTVEAGPAPLPQAQKHQSPPPQQQQQVTPQKKLKWR